MRKGEYIGFSFIIINYRVYSTHERPNSMT